MKPVIKHVTYYLGGVTVPDRSAGGCVMCGVIMSMCSTHTRLLLTFVITACCRVSCDMRHAALGYTAGDNGGKALPRMSLYLRKRIRPVFPQDITESLLTRQSDITINVISVTEWLEFTQNCSRLV